MSWCPIHVNQQFDPECSGCQNASPQMTERRDGAATPAAKLCAPETHYPVPGSSLQEKCEKGDRNGERSSLRSVIEAGIVQEIDGTFYFYPPQNGACFASHTLREIADALDAKNQEWVDYFGENYGKKGPWLKRILDAAKRAKAAWPAWAKK